MRGPTSVAQGERRRLTTRCTTSVNFTKTPNAPAPWPWRDVFDSPEATPVMRHRHGTQTTRAHGLFLHSTLVVPVAELKQTLTTAMSSPRENHGYGPAIAHGSRSRPAQRSRSDTRDELFHWPGPSFQKRSRTDTRDAQGPGIPCLSAKSARGRTREKLKARDSLPSRQERSRTDTRDAQGPGIHCLRAKSARGRTRDMLKNTSFTALAPRALADGHARCSRPRDSLPSRQERSRTDTRDAQGPGIHCLRAKSARGRTREMLKAPGFTAFAPTALADGHARCSRPRDSLPSRQERSLTDTRDAQGPGIHCLRAKSARGQTREMLKALRFTAFAPRALADGHARCSMTRDSLPSRQERSRTDTRDAQGPGIHCLRVKSAGGRTREMLKAPGFTAFALRALADGHARCSEAPESLHPRRPYDPEGALPLHDQRHEPSGAISGHHADGPAISRGPRFRPARRSRTATRDAQGPGNPFALAARRDAKGAAATSSATSSQRLKPSSKWKEMSTPKWRTRFVHHLHYEVHHDCLHPIDFRESALIKKGQQLHETSMLKCHRNREPIHDPSLQMLQEPNTQRQVCRPLSPRRCTVENVLVSPPWLPTYPSLTTPATDCGLCQRLRAHFDSATPTGVCDQDSDHGYEPAALSQDSDHGYGPAIAHGPRFRPAQCSRRKREMLKASGFTASARGQTREINFDWHNPPYQERSRTDTRDAQGLGIHCLKPSCTWKERSTPK